MDFLTTIGFIRHGITEWNELEKAQGISDIPLNEVGRQQALKLGERLSQENWDMIMTSDLSRATETAKIITTIIDKPIISFDERIREIDCGEIEGTTEQERLIKWGADWRNLVHGMERFEDVSRRGINFLEEMASLYKNKRILVVSHGALIGLTLQHLLPERFPTTHIDNTSVTILHNIEGVWNCGLYNCIKHLQ